jgi:NRAMP (natural resistance-associated macrophage protein)-like metal ion transporter
VNWFIFELFLIYYYHRSDDERKGGVNMTTSKTTEKKTMWQRIKNMGPGAIVTAAVVGPGTVTTCGLSGYGFGYGLAWALIFSVIAMFIMQLMTSKIGIIGEMGLADSIRKVFAKSPFRIPLFILLIAAIFCGNCAYQAGNVVGASVGLSILFGPYRTLFCIVISGAALAIVLSGNIKYISNALTALVFVMAMVFLLTAFIVGADFTSLLHGMFVPSIPNGAMLNAIGLIGTTLVPYCLYLHASTTASEKIVDKEDALIDAKYDSVTNAILTAIISISIMIVGHSLAVRGETVKGVADLAMGLEPLAGAGAKAIFSIGIFAAGISSATTAPLAATYVITGILGWSTDLKDKKFRMITTVVFILGCIVAIMGGTPTNIITIAQAVNGVALPLSVCLVVYVANDMNLLGSYKNTGILNGAGAAVFVITLFMAYRTFIVYAPKLAHMAA